MDHDVTGGVHGVVRSELLATPRAHRHLLGLTINDAYVINGFLGAGGFGAVYRATQVALDRDVALKLLMLDDGIDQASVERFKREAKTAAALLDPNVVTLFDYGEATLREDGFDNVLFFAMEYVEGPTLSEMLRKNGGFDLAPALDIAAHVLRGLAAAHRRGVVHRDLKPGNVLIDELKRRGNFARLFDFGISSLIGSGGKTATMNAGAVVGTPKYMAPEQWLGHATSPATDVYAFGAILAELLTGKPAVPRDETVVMYDAHLKGARPHVTETARGEAVPPEVTAFVQRCMAIEMADRFPDAGEALTELETFWGGFGTSAPPRPAPPPSIPELTAPGELDVTAAGEVQGVNEPGAAQVAAPAPRPVWPLVLAAFCAAIAVVALLMVNRLAGEQETAASGVVTPRASDAAATPPTAVVAAKVVDAAVVAKVMDAAVVAVVPDAAPARPTPAKRRWRPRNAAEKAERAAKVAKPTTPAAPVAKPAPIPAVAASPERAVIEYAGGKDAEARGAPKTALRRYRAAISAGLVGAKAADAKVRIRRIEKAAAAEDDQF